MTEIDLRDVVSNADNSRDSVPKLTGLGYGVVEPAGDKPALFALALGTAEQKREFCRQVQRWEPGLVDLADSIECRGQLTNCRVRPAGVGKYVLTFGCRRALAVLYLHARSGGDRPPVVWATVGGGDDLAALIESAAENAHRLPPSPIDQARLFKRLRDAGLSAAEVAKAYSLGRAGEQVVRLRLRLLELSEDVQLKVHAGSLTQDAALKLLRRPTHAAFPTGPTGDGVFAQSGAADRTALVLESASAPSGLTPVRGAERRLRAGPDEQTKLRPLPTDPHQALTQVIEWLCALDLEAGMADDPSKLLRLVEEAGEALGRVRVVVTRWLYEPVTACGRS